MELAAAVRTVEAIAPVDADKSKHRHIESDAKACRVVDLERLELTHCRPRVTTLEESEDIDSGASALDDRLTQFESVAVEDRGTVSRAEATIGVSTQWDDLTTVEHPR